MATARPDRPLPAATAWPPGLRLSILEGGLAQVFGTFTSGVFLTGFALLLGAGPWALGLMAAVPAVGQLAQLVAAPMLARWGRRKAITVWCASLGRYLWLPIGALPFLPGGADIKLLAFFVLLALSTVLAQIAGVTWNDWMADAVPADGRGRYFGLRNAFCALIGMGVTGLGTRYLDAFGKAGQEAWGFLGLVGAAMLAAVASQVALSRQPEPAAVAPRERGVWWAPFRAPLADPRFRRLAPRLFAWSFVIGLTGPFFYAYGLQRLHLGYGTLGLHAMAVAGLSIVSQPLWGRLIDQVGALRVLILCMGPVCLHPLYWMWMTPEFTAPLWLDALSSGLVWPGVTLATTALLMELSPSGGRAAYMGLMNTLSGLASVLAGLAGGALLAVLGDRVFSLMGVPVLMLQAAFGVSALLRVGAFGALVLMPARPALLIDTWAAETRVPARPVESAEPAA